MRSANRFGFDLTAPLKICRTLQNVGGAFIASDNVNTKKDDDNLFLYFTNDESDFKLENTDKKDARRIWVVELGGKMVSGLLLADENLFLIVKSGDKYVLKSLSRLTGVTNWQSTPFSISSRFEGEPTEEFFLHAYRSTVIVVGRSGEIYSFGKNDGRERWNVLLENNLTATPAFGDNLVAVGLADGKLKIVSLNDGVELKRFESVDAAKASGTLAVSIVSAVIFQTAGRIIYGDNRGFLTAVDLESGKTFWKMRSAAAAITGIERAPKGLLISSLDNFIYFVSYDKGRRLWKRRLAGRVVYRPLILDRYAVVINSFAPRADIIELLSGKTVNQIDFDEENYFIGDIVFGGSLLAFQTARGLTVFHADGICSSTASITAAR
jgi:outer membrane protein assembly factor BamB